MARDLIFGKTTRNWATGSDTSLPENPPKHKILNVVVWIGLLLGVPGALLLGSDYLDKTGWFKNRR
jgi:hypothetical protein